MVLPVQFERYLFITHLLALRDQCNAKKELQAFAAHQAVSLLRYADVLPADRVFFEAGEIAKVEWGICLLNSFALYNSSQQSTGRTNMAFVCWNRYLDLSEAIEDGAPSSSVDNADFENTDVPWDVELPGENLPV